jgi:predicted nucleotidyltransferase
MQRLPKRDIRRLLEVLDPIEGVRCAVLYGSIARGDYGPNSDMDVFILVGDRGAVAEVRESLASAEFPRRVQPTVRTLEQIRNTDFGLLRNIFREGLVLFSRRVLDLPAAGLLHLKPCAVFSFELGTMPQKEKARFNRLLYQSRKKGKSDNVLDKAGGRRLGKGSVLIRADGTKHIEALFRKFKIRFQRLDVWL